MRGPPLNATLVSSVRDAPVRGTGSVRRGNAWSARERTRASRDFASAAHRRQKMSFAGWVERSETHYPATFESARA